MSAHLQVMPVHATRILPGSERITSNVPQLMATFDPAKPVHFEVSRQLRPEWGSCAFSWRQLVALHFHNVLQNHLVFGWCLPLNRGVAAHHAYCVERHNMCDTP